MACHAARETPGNSTATCFTNTSCQKSSPNQLSCNFAANNQESRWKVHVAVHLWCNVFPVAYKWQCQVLLHLRLDTFSKTTQHLFLRALFWFSYFTFPGSEVRASRWRGVFLKKNPYHCFGELAVFSYDSQTSWLNFGLGCHIYVLYLWTHCLC